MDKSKTTQVIWKETLNDDFVPFHKLTYNATEQPKSKLKDFVKLENFDDKLVKKIDYI